MTTVDRPAGHRGRLLSGMVSAVAAKGYADVTIADVVSEAGVSKRTFYEHFASKQDCLLACFREAATMMQAELWQHAVGSTHRPRPDQLRTVLDGYLAYLDRYPAMARTLLIEIQAAGADGRRLRRESQLQMAQMLAQMVKNGRGESAAPFDPNLAIAVVGGVTELVLVHAENHPNEPFSILGPSVLRFVAAVVRA